MKIEDEKVREQLSDDNLDRYCIELKKPTLKDKLWVLTSETNEQWWSIYVMGLLWWNLMCLLFSLEFDVLEYPLTILTMFKILYNDN